jgi:hypothetical protein
MLPPLNFAIAALAAWVTFGTDEAPEKLPGVGDVVTPPVGKKRKRKRKKK